jgi:hypothetical protein
MRSWSIAGAGMLCLAGSLPASAQARVESWLPEPLRFESSAGAAVNARAALAGGASATRRSPGWARFGGGLVTGTGTLIGLLAATWNDPDAVADPLVYGAYALGTMAGSAAVTSFWEKPNRGLAAGAALGALPLLLAMSTEDDDTAGGLLIAAWIGSPLAAAVGQRLRSPRPVP